MQDLLTNHLPQWTQETHFIIATWKWFALLIALFLGFIFKNTAKFFLGFFIKVTDRDSFRWQNRFFKELERPSGLIIASLFWYICLQSLSIEGTTEKILSTLIQMTFSAALVWAVYNLSDLLSDLLKVWTSKTETTLDDHLLPLVSKSLKLFIVVFGTLIALQNLGINVLSVLAGLGLGGLAFALAAKDTCANFFGSLMILIDRPFAIGDWVVASGEEGTVEDIGFRSTRIRTFYDSVVSIPNANMANINIDNMGRRKYRRTNTTLGVTYNTPPEKIENFMEGIKDLIRNHPDTRKDYFHVCFSGYGASSLDIMLYFFLETSDWTAELKARQQLYLDILKLAEKLAVEFAFPTQTLHVESFPETVKA